MTSLIAEMVKLVPDPETAYWFDLGTIPKHVPAGRIEWERVRIAGKNPLNLAEQGAKGQLLDQEENRLDSNAARPSAIPLPGCAHNS
jgi:hypothetical protein